MILHKYTILLTSIFFFPIISILFGNVNIGGANLQFFFSLFSLTIVLFYLVKWGEFKLNISILPLLSVLFLTAPLFNEKFGAIQIIYVISPFLYFMAGAYSNIDQGIIEKLKKYIEIVLFVLIILSLLTIFGEYSQINSRPVSIFISLITMISIILIDKFRYRILAFLLVLFVLFSGARGALFAGLIPLLFSYINKKLSFKLSILLYTSIIILLLIFNEKFLSIIFSVDALRERTFYDGIYSYEKILNFEFNTSGRDIAWPMYWDHVSVRSKDIIATLIGEGPGATSIIGVENLGDRWAHPHNEFIRILIDYGIIGIISFLIFWTGITYKVLKNLDNNIIRLYVSMLIFGLLIAMTDNPLMYPLYFGNIILFLSGLCLSFSKSSNKQ